MLFTALETINFTEVGEDFGLFSPKTAEKVLTAVKKH